MTLLERVAQRLRDEHVTFALVGAGALAAHGVSRSTHDTDLLAVSARALAQAIWAEVAAAGIEVDVRAGDHDDPLLGVVRFTHDSESVDLVLGRHEWQQAIIERAEDFDGLGVNIPLVRAADLVLLKLYAGGIQDRWDVAQLLGDPADSVISAEVEQRLGELPAYCRGLWEQIRRGS